MFKSKTLFIVGAGASREAGLPTGAELKPKIAKTIDIKFEHNRQTEGDHLVTEALRQVTLDPQTDRSGSITPFIHAARKVRGAMPLALSIDNFIDAHRGDEKIALVGKLAIVRCILAAERDSLLNLDPRDLQFTGLSDTWFSAFFQLATETVAQDEVARAFENVSFITFNYDRCIEHFLVLALKTYYGLDDAAAQALVVQKVPIIHPYGQVGRLPWQPGGNTIAFGHDLDRGDELLALSTQVKTFTERVEDEVALRAMRQCVEEAETIVFLGFAYHPKNLKLIAPEQPNNARRIFGTTKGMSESDTMAVTVDLLAWLKQPSRGVETQLEDTTCAKLFTEFWRSIPGATNS